MTNEMTAEEAKEFLIDISYKLGNMAVEYLTEKDGEKMRKAIQALEAQPSEDDFVKHKKEVLERIAKRESEIDKYIKELEALEQQPCEDCISRQAVLNGLANIAKAKAKSDAQKALMGRVMFFTEQLPSVTPRRDLAETSQDCISREEVQDLISRWLSDYLLDETREALETINYKVGDMPSVTPQYTDEEIDKAQAVEQAYVDKMVELAVEETKRPKGKWIKIQSGNEDFPESIVCSRCKNENSHLDFDEHSEPIGKIFVTSKYCPNCGAEMSGGGEDETDS